MKMIQTVLCTGMLALASVAMAEEFSSTPKPETLQQAIAFEKHKIAAAEAQARKDAAEAARGAQATEDTSARKARTARKNTARKTGQADSTPKR